MERDKWFYDEIDGLLEDAIELRSSIDKLRDLRDPIAQLEPVWPDELDGDLRKMESAKVNIKDSLNALRTSDYEQSQRHALSALSAVNLMDTITGVWATRVSDLLSDQTINMSVSLRGTITKVWSWIKKHLKPLILKISSRLWQLISRLLTPKGWSVSGTSGVALFGFTGTCTITVQFGP